MNHRIVILSGLAFIAPYSLAATTQSASITQPTTCIVSQFTSSGDQYWQSVTLKLTNQCGKTVDFQNATITFKSKTALNTTFWGNFSPLSYPDNTLNMSSQTQADGSFLATLNLHFPSYTGANSQLPAGGSVQIQYGTNAHNVIADTTNVYLGTVVASGTVTLSNTSAQPDNVAQNYALVHITMNGQVVKDVQVPWKGSAMLTLAAGNYTITPENITDTNGNNYQASAIPNTVTLAADQKVSSTLSYIMVKPTGSINLSVQALPDSLSGYSSNPTVLVSEIPSGSSVSKVVSWSTTTPVTSLVSDKMYQLSTGTIDFNNYTCAPTFTPATILAKSASPASARLTYQCVQVRQDSITVTIDSAPTTLSSINVTLTPNDHSTPLTQTIALSEGSGSSTVSLNDGMIYTLSMEPISGYSASFSPQPLTATDNGSVTISLSKNDSSEGRIIGYLPGWKTPPSATSLANAGYTHITVAFGVFSTITPGEITSAFGTVTKDYIESLHQAGIKVILSLGGASSSIPNTTVDFHQVLSAAPSEASFQQTFIASLKDLMTQYGFDGFDIDIEHGLTANGTFTAPQGDIAVLANIINTMYNDNPSLLITLAPQVANVSATSGFDQTWGNYASLITQTYRSLAWVGIQLYNTGCAYGIDKVCYSPTASPDFTVAMATDLLANWPATLENGSSSGFQAYISNLKPSQVVVGYPAPNDAGVSDGAPVTPNTTIKHALQCLKTAVASPTSCDTYLPPKAYGMIGGVFNWEVTYDQSNGFKFATELKNCVKTGVCE